jgi:cytochrome P450
VTDLTLVDRPPFFLDGGASLLPWLREARNTHPVHFDDTSHTWRVLRHDDAVRVLSDWKLFSSDMMRMMPQQELVEGNFAVMDPPRHRQYRGFVSQAFSRRSVATLAAKIEQRVRGCLAAAHEAGAIEVVRELAYPLPLSVIADLFGIPEPDREVMQRYADAQVVLTAENPMDESFIRTRESAMRELLDYLRELSRQRRRAPGDDLISELATAEVDDKTLTEAELLTFATLLLGAGHVTTMGVLSNLFVCLAEHPVALPALRRQPGLAPGAVEEVLRLRPPVPDASRITAAEVRIGDVELGPDQLILISLLSANHDERQFADPERLDPTRAPNPQLAFSHGIHFCLGAHLARLEAQVLLRVVMERFEGVALREVEWHQSHALTAPSRLVVDLDPA